ncbi:hypothetical protein BB561_002932 [Smittium simulii]|uniref:Pre-mRNA-splicing factor SLT11 n=1 Tax=Smittium simulii TaxID=133385 RepID=A0A2T9YNP9_9FUNG|nr:hypothetical protein BB561_002932 [Smittium simulii]
MSKAENKETWEDSASDNPYVRMTKQKFGDECKICQRPFTVFRWSPGAKMRYKKTEICQICAKNKNVCQTCVLDLKYGLPVQARDAVLQITENAPRSDVNKQFYNQSIETRIETGQLNTDFSGVNNPSGREQLLRMSRHNPYYKRNMPHICSFFVKGECTRGNECPYRHELPTDDPELSKQNIADRYHGTNDPVAKKLLDRQNKKNENFTPPDDKSITSLFLSTLHESITEADIKDYFICFGEIKSIVLVTKSKCAFVNFVHRVSAEAAADRSFGGCSINGHAVRLSWGKTRPKGPQNSITFANLQNNPEIAEKLAKKGINSSIVDNGVILPPRLTTGVLNYPSQDSTLQGSNSFK